jgi:hypothetical protein
MFSAIKRRPGHGLLLAERHQPLHATPEMGGYGERTGSSLWRLIYFLTGGYKVHGLPQQLEALARHQYNKPLLPPLPISQYHTQRSPKLKTFRILLGYRATNYSSTS